MLFLVKLYISNAERSLFCLNVKVLHHDVSEGSVVSLAAEQHNLTLGKQSLPVTHIRCHRPRFTTTRGCIECDEMCLVITFVTVRRQSELGLTACP